MATRQPLSGQTQQTNSPDAVRKQGRDPRQRQTARRINLQPQASPGRYYSRPANKQVGQKSEQLAGALSKLSPEVGKLGSYIADKKRTEAQREAETASQQMTPEEMQEAIDSGEIAEHDNPYYQEAYQKQYGIRLGLHQGRKIKASMKAGNFNPREQSAEEFIAENMSVNAYELQSNDIVEEGFSAAMGQSISQVREMAAGQRAEAEREDTLQGAHEIDREMTRETAQQYAEAETDEERDAAYEAYRENTEGVRDNLHSKLDLSNKELDAIHLENIQEMAENGQYGLVKRIVTDDRDGVGSLVGKRGPQGTKAQKLMDVAEKNRDDKNREEAFETRVYFDRMAVRGQFDMAEARQVQQNNPGSITDAEIRQWGKQQERERQKQVRASQAARQERAIQTQQSEEQAELLGHNVDLLENGNLKNVRPVMVTGDDGEPTEMSIKDQIQKATEYRIREVIPQEAAEQYPDDEQAQQQYIADHVTLAEQQAGPDYKNKQREHRYNAVQAGMSPQVISSNDGEVPDPTVQTMLEFEEMNARSPGRAKLDSGSNYDMMMDVVEVKNDLGLSMADAIKKVSNQRSANSGEGLDYNTTVTNDQWDNDVVPLYDDALTTDEHTFWFNDKNEMRNPNHLRKLHNDAKNAIASNGGVPTDENAAKRVAKSHMQIGGHFVKYNGSAMPKDQMQGELVGRRDAVYDANKDKFDEEGVERDNIVVGVDTSGKYYLMFDDGEPLTPVDEGGDVEGSLRVSGISERTLSEQELKERDEAVRQRQERAESNRQEEKEQREYREKYGTGPASSEQVEQNMPTSLNY